MRRSIVGIKRAFAAGLLYVACLQPQMQAQGGSTPAPADRAQLVPNGGYYALVIGINDYAPPLPKLATAVADARSIAQVLSDSYGFQVKLLLDQDATRSNILKTIAQYRYKLNENDNLLIYYAGHGISDRRADKAYWIPVDADSVDSPNRIIADEITTDVRGQSARHVLIISDSCYSGGLTRGADAPVQSAGQMAFLNRMLKSASRTLMASGGDEPVSDGGPDGHSVFAYAVLRSLQQTDQSVFTASDLFYGSVRQQVAGRSSQLPEYSIIRNSNHDDGDFVFVRTAVAKPTGRMSIADAAELSAKGKALLDANRFAEALPLLQRSCEAGDGSGCTNLGYLYDEGMSSESDLARAAESYQKGCKLKDMVGCKNLGIAYEAGLGVEKDPTRAADLYRQACSGNEAVACTNLGLAYGSGSGVGKDFVRAAALYRQGCDGKDLIGCGNLGISYENGEGVEKDLARAAKLFRQACDGNVALACLDLGIAYHEGLGVAKDLPRAAALYRQACDGKNMLACNNLGGLYQEGSGVKKDTVRAAALYRQACDGKYSGGCANLGNAYEIGSGVVKDLAQAAALYRQACDGNDAFGCGSIGYLYATGTGVAQNMAEAAKLFRLACDRGDGRSCYFLALAYRSGSGVETDEAQAGRLVRRSCEVGYADACAEIKPK